VRRVYGVDQTWLVPAPIDAFFTTVAIALGVTLWVVLARSHFIRGGNVERPERVPQLYGYSICLVAVIVMLTSLSTIVDKTFSLADPLFDLPPELGWAEPAVTSFEAYRATHDREQRFGPGGERQPREVLPEAELRRRYEAVRADRIARARFGARRALTRSTVMFIVAAGLFWVHWRWVRSREQRSGGAAASAPPEPAGTRPAVGT
jgi:hypothetical protein